LSAIHNANNFCYRKHKSYEVLFILLAQAGSNLAIGSQRECQLSY